MSVRASELGKSSISHLHTGQGAEHRGTNERIARPELGFGIGGQKSVHDELTAAEGLWTSRSQLRPRILEAKWSVLAVKHDLETDLRFSLLMQRLSAVLPAVLCNLPCLTP